jgi:hypothetical protein
VLIGSELILTLGSLGLAINALLPRPSLAVIFAVTAFMSAVNGFHRPALESMTPLLVATEELPATAALTSLRSTAGAIAGPALGGLCIATLGLPVAYVIDVASFLLSVIALVGMSSMPAPREAAQPGLRSIAQGLSYARSRPELIGTYVVDMVAMTFAMPMALFPALAQPWGGARAAGWLYSAMWMGSFVTTLFSGWTGKVRRHGAAVVVAAAAWGLAVVALGYAPGLVSAVLCLAVAGGADMISGLFRTTIWNETIPSRLRGRLASVEMISYLSGPLLGNARAGWMASVSGNRFSIVSGGLACTVAVLALIAVLPTFWRYRSGAHQAPRSDGDLRAPEQARLEEGGQ